MGACSTMTAKQAAAQADRSTVVPCSQAHAAKVAGVVRLPDGLNYSSKILKLYRVIVDKCRPKANQMLGRTSAVRDSSAYDLVWFTPTKRQRQHGARWISAPSSSGRPSSAKLPADKTPLLPSGKARRRHPPLPPGRHVAHHHHQVQRPARLAGDRIFRDRQQELPRGQGDQPQGPHEVRQPRAPR